MRQTYQCLVYFFAMNGRKEIHMKLSNGREVIARRYQEQDAEAIVNLIRRNFLEVNVKDYGKKAMKALAVMLIGLRVWQLMRMYMFSVSKRRL